MSLFLGMWMAFIITTPIHAQFSVNVNSDTSPTTFQMIQQMAQQLVAQTSIATDAKASKLEQILEYAKQAQRWISTVEHYSTMIINDIKKFTSLKGILQTVEKNLGLSDDTLKALSDIGQLIRASFTLKNNFMSLVRTRLQMIESLERRARQGIFSPSQDLDDLEEYLRYSIGRQAGATLATRRKLAETDTVLEQLTYDLQQVRAERAAVEKELKDLNAKLEQENSLSSNPRATAVDNNGSSTTTFNGRNSQSPEAITTMTIRKGQLEEQLIKLKEREQQIIEKIRNRYIIMQANYDGMYTKGKYWSTVLEGWNAFEHVKTEELERMIDTYGTTRGTGNVPSTR
jgi:hypothetical protein